MFNDMSSYGWRPSFSSRQPLFYLGGVGVDTTTFLTGLHILTIILCAFAISTGNFEWIKQYFAYSTDGFLNGKVWTPFTYLFLHDIRTENLFFAIEMLFFWFFSRDVESYLGVRAYLWLYSLLTVIPPLFMLILTPLLGALPPYWSSGSVHFSIFIAFTILYPNARLFFFGITAKWAAVILLSISSLSALASHQWLSLSYLWVSVGVTFIILRNTGSGKVGSSVFHWIEEQKNKAAEKKIQEEQTTKENKEKEHHEAVDAILEKISSHGIQSLTDREKQVLEHHRAKLVEREKKKK